MEPDTPSQIREQVLAQHDVLRLRLEDLSKGVSGLRAGELDVAELRLLVSDTLALLRAHVMDEESWLLPVLQDIDGFGPVRAAALEDEHKAQQKEMKQTLQDLRATVDPRDLATKVESLVQRILEDMDEEEATYLSADLLKDDLITTGFIG